MNNTCEGSSQQSGDSKAVTKLSKVDSNNYWLILGIKISERMRKKMVIMILSLLVGVVVGTIFKMLKLPVPVPHDFSGIIGLMGMFIGSALADRILMLISK